MITGICHHCGAVNQQCVERDWSKRHSRVFCFTCGWTDHYRTDTGTTTHLPRRHVEPTPEPRFAAMYRPRPETP